MYGGMTMPVRNSTLFKTTGDMSHLIVDEKKVAIEPMLNDERQVEHFAKTTQSNELYQLAISTAFKNEKYNSLRILLFGNSIGIVIDRMLFQAENFLAVKDTITPQQQLGAIKWAFEQQSFGFDQEMILLLLEMNIGENWNRIVCMASGVGSIVILKKLFKEKDSIGFFTRDLAIKTAAKNGKENAVQFLLGKKPVLDESICSNIAEIESNTKKDAIKIACKEQHFAVVRVLIADTDTLAMRANMIGISFINGSYLSSSRMVLDAIAYSIAPIREYFRVQNDGNFTQV